MTPTYIHVAGEDAKVYERLGGKKYTRIEVIGDGREYVYYGEVWAVEQDGGKTLKVFKVIQ